jgi:antitoxin YefM
MAGAVQFLRDKIALMRGQSMPDPITYSQARVNLASLCDRATVDREVIIIRRRGAGDVALIAADELAGLVEVAHLLKSPENARRLLTALERAQARTRRPEAVADLREEVGLGPKESSARAKKGRA